MKKPLIIRWLVFTYERFPPLSHILLILLFYTASFFISFASLGIYFTININIISGFFIILLFFYHLRIFDEIKDYETDKIIHPERPLARGLVSVKTAKVIAFIVIIFELGLSFLTGYKAQMILVITILFSLLMYKEFFLKEKLSKRLVLYALTHTPVSCLLVLTIFSIVTKKNFWQIKYSFLLFIGVNFLISAIFEFGRKVFSKDEETPGRDTYSKKFGIIGASFIVLFLIVLSCIITCYIGCLLKVGMLFYFLFGSLFFLSLIIIILFVTFKNKTFAKIFRAMSGVYILLYNLSIIIGLLWKIKIF